MTRAILPALVATMVLVSATHALAQEVTGPAEVIDGDTLSMGDMRIRLFGIDAPELSQTCDRSGEAWACGETAKAELAKLVQGNSVTCLSHETDAYGRLVATCRVDRLDLGEAMVGAGWATAYTQYSTDYVEREALAKRFKFGIWAATFDTPATWRAAHPRPAPKTRRTAAPTQRVSKPAIYRDAAGRCAIKGNHSRYGDWIYHLPGQEYYEQTRPEARFCTEEAAQRAGYRRSKA